MRNFPFGHAALAILLLALLSGAWLTAHSASQGQATLRMWVFGTTHYNSYKVAIKSFEAQHPGVTVDLQLAANSSLPERLQAAFLSDADVPDLVEIEISSAGSFFRGPLNHVGFRDLTDRIHRSGLWDKMVRARFAPYTKQGHIFGLPHDVHPVCLAYNREVFEREGVDVDKIHTWDDFIAVGRKLTRIGTDHDRYMIDLADNVGDNLETCLFQRGGGYFDPEGRCILDNAAAVETMKWYVPLVAGPHRIGNDVGGLSSTATTKAIEDGYVLSLICPDWRTRLIEDDVPRMSGKMALMPFPSVAPGTPRTSTWGGTMLGITKRCKHPDLAWQLAMHLYLDKPQLAERFRQTNILPCMREAWDQPAFREPRAYWSNQPLGKIYAALAPQVPFQYTSAFIHTAKDKLSEALVSCVQQYKSQGDVGFDAFCRGRLRQSADEVRTLMARNPY